MKQLIVFILVLSLLIIPMTGCKQTGTVSDGKLNIVCTIFPQYDWVRQILGDKADDVNLTLLLKNRIDLHSYQPSVDDMAKISSCDLFIYVGGESDLWVDGALKEAANKKMIVINLLETLGNAAKIEEILEGMEADHDEDDEDDEDDHDHGDEDDHDHGDEYDEHIWLSLSNAVSGRNVIADAISSLDTGNADKYKNNLDAYLADILALDADFRTVVSAAPVRTLLFGDRFPFRYLMDDYGLTPYAAFSGCSAETEASFETIIFLAGKVDELDLKAVVVTESSNMSIARTIINNTKNKSQQIMVLDSMQSVTENDVKNGVTYFSIMDSNLSVLKDALK